MLLYAKWETAGEQLRGAWSHVVHCSGPLYGYTNVIVYSMMVPNRRAAPTGALHHRVDHN